MFVGGRQRLSLYMELSIHCNTALVLGIGCKFGYLIATYNEFHIILRLSDALPNFPFTTSETMSDYLHGIRELPHELPNNLRLKIKFQENV